MAFPTWDISSIENRRKIKIKKINEKIHKRKHGFLTSMCVLFFSKATDRAIKSLV